jgi:hypothetical protein
MAKFLVSASERVFYEVEVEADSLEHAQALAEAGEISWGDAIDGQDFSVDFIEEQSDDTDA